MWVPRNTAATSPPIHWIGHGAPVRPTGHHSTPLFTTVNRESARSSARDVDVFAGSGRGGGGGRGGGRHSGRGGRRRPARTPAEPGGAARVAVERGGAGERKGGCGNAETGNRFGTLSRRTVSRADTGWATAPRRTLRTRRIPHTRSTPEDGVQSVPPAERPPAPVPTRRPRRHECRHRPADRRERRARPGRQAGGRPDRAGDPARRGPPADRGRARRRQDLAGQGAGPVDRLLGQPDPVHPGPAAQRRHRRLASTTGRPRDFEFRPGPVFANIVVGDEINRASPEDPVRAAGVHGGAPGHRRRQDLRAGGAVHGGRHPEPDRDGGHLRRCPRPSATASPRGSRSATRTAPPSWPWSTSTPATTRWTR